MTMIESNVEALGDPDETARRRAADRLAAIAKERTSLDGAMPTLLALLVDDPSDAVRSAASTAVGWSAHHGWVDRDRIAMFVALLGDRVPMIRHDAAWVLESFAQRGVADASALDPLLANLSHAGEDASADVRAAAIYALGAHLGAGVGPADHVCALIAVHREDPAENCRDAAVRVLAKAAPDRAT